jgi:hypothetical protein
MGSHDPFGYLKHKLWPKEGPRVELPICQFDSRPLKVRNRPNFLEFMWRATYHWKSLDKGYNFASNLTLIGGLHIKLWDSKVVGIPILGILGPPLGSPWTKWHLGANLWSGTRKYYKGEGGGFPQVWVVLSLVSPCLFVARMCTKNVLAMH